MAFMFEKLEVYQKAVCLADSVAAMTQDFPRGFGFLADQLNRAALSIAANIAEGNGRFTKADRRNFFGIARGSVQECVPLLELASRQTLLKPEQHQQLKADLEEIGRMCMRAGRVIRLLVHRLKGADTMRVPRGIRGTACSLSAGLGWRHVSLCFLFLPALLRCSWADDAELRARLESEAPQSWSEFQELSKHLDIELTQQVLHPDTTTKTKLVVRTAGENALFSQSYLDLPEVQRERLQGVEHVECQNSEKFFKLEKRGPDLPWFVEYIGDRGGLSAKKSLDPMLFFPFRVYRHSISDWFQSPDFQIRDVQWAQRPAGKLVAVTFELAKPEEETYWIHDGTIYLNPDRMWAVQEFVYDATGSKGEEHVEQQTEFRDDCGELPLVKTANLTAQTPIGKVQHIFDFNRFKRREIPEQEFTLTAFGIPEISPPTRWRSAWLLYVLIGITVVCLAAAIWVRRHSLA